MKYILNHEGKPYYKFFEDICSIPHTSYNERELSDYIVEFAKTRNLWWYQDDIWNVVIKKPASAGYEGHPPVMIQGHIDMVGEKTPDSDFNFNTDSLELYVEDGWLKAKNTTLGADCGHGIAYMLAILDDKNLQHPPLECFFSVQEEVGIGGPQYIDYSLFTAKRLISTDQMFEGATVISTTSVVGGEFIKPVSLTKNTKSTYLLKVEGLQGGHAATNIHKEQANAIKIVARVLYNLTKKVKLQLASIDGGTIRNNIPEVCSATFTCDSTCYDLVKDIVNAAMEEEKREHQISDPDLNMILSPAETVEETLDDLSTNNVVELLHVIPTGVYMRSLEEENLVLTSRNIGNITIKDGILKFGYLFRSAIDSQIFDLMNQAMITADRFGAVFRKEYYYAGYTVSKDTPLNILWQEVYKEASGKDLRFISMHVGTDAGTIINRRGGMDVISIGPNTVNFHKPGEALELASFDRTYGYLKTILSRL